MNYIKKLVRLFLDSQHNKGELPPESTDPGFEPKTKATKAKSLHSK